MSGPDSVCEGDGAAEYCVTVNTPFERDVFASVTTSDVTASSTIDYTAVSLDFIFDVGSDPEMCFNVNIANDGTSESCKSFDLSLDSSSVRAEIPVPSMNVLLYDDDGK